MHPFSLRLFSRVNYYRTSSRVRCAVQQLLFRSLSHIQQCVCVNPKLLIYPSLSCSPLVTRNLLLISINLFLLCKSVHLHHFWTLVCAQGSLYLLLLLKAVPESNFDPSTFQHRHLILQPPLQGQACWPRVLSRLLSQACVQWHGLSQSAKCKHSMKAWPCVFGDVLIYLTRDRSGLKPEESKAGPCSWHLHTPSTSHVSPLHPSRLGKRVLPYSSSSSS